MSRRTTKLLKAALTAVHYSGAGSLLAPFTGNAGVIFVLHQVRPEPPQPFEPNRILKVTPQFLEEVISSVLAAGFDAVALDAVPDRLRNERLRNSGARPFACFTLDDGYRDNREQAYPIFKRHNVPFTVYVSADYADGDADLWWITLEKVLRAARHITLAMDGRSRTFPLTTVAEKDLAYHEIYWWLRSIPEDLARDAIAELASLHGVDASVARDELMTWGELRELAKDPLVTIGAHTTSHRALAKLGEAEARLEMAESIRRIEQELAIKCRHFSYPYGCAKSAGQREFALARELGMATAVTTRKGLLFAEHAQALMALPRLSLNGDYQDMRYVKALLSGVPFAVLNTLQRITGKEMAA